MRCDMVAPESQRREVQTETMHPRSPVQPHLTGALPTRFTYIVVVPVVGSLETNPPSNAPRGSRDRKAQKINFPPS